MIGYLHGKLLAIEKNTILIDVHNVGYTVACAEKNYQNLALGDKITLYTEAIWRENEVTLYGFASLSQREWFRLLGTVPGVGAKMALGLLAHFSPYELTNFIFQGNNRALTSAHGVGSKLAQRIINELVDKLPPLCDLSSTENSDANDDFATALSGLIALGFPQNKAQKILIDICNHHKSTTNIANHTALPADKMLYLALKTLGKPR